GVIVGTYPGCNFVFYPGFVPHAMVHIPGKISFCTQDMYRILLISRTWPHQSTLEIFRSLSDPAGDLFHRKREPWGAQPAFPDGAHPPAGRVQCITNFEVAGHVARELCGPE